MKITAALLLPMLLMFGVTHGQSASFAEIDTFSVCSPDWVFSLTEDMPDYEGGYQRLEEELNNCLSLRESYKGRIYARLTINCEGHAGDIQIIQSALTDLNDSLIDCLWRAQHWNAATQRQERVDCYLWLNLKCSRGRIRIIR